MPAPTSGGGGTDGGGGIGMACCGMVWKGCGGNGWPGGGVMWGGGGVAGCLGVWTAAAGTAAGLAPLEDPPPTWP